jgi:hypothetical protein
MQVFIGKHGNAAVKIDLRCIVFVIKKFEIHKGIALALFLSLKMINT